MHHETYRSTRGTLVSLAGLGLVALGGALMWRGERDGRRRRAKLEKYGAGVTSGIYDGPAQAAKEQRYQVGDPIEDIVDESSDDSFPCSDPPSFTAR